jgi:hypothetical protein
MFVAGTNFVQFFISPGCWINFCGTTPRARPVFSSRPSVSGLHPSSFAYSRPCSMHVMHKNVRFETKETRRDKGTRRTLDAHVRILKRFDIFT